MITYPDDKTREACELYDLMCRVCAIASIVDNDVLRAVRNWLRIYSGAEMMELQALTDLINCNIEPDNEVIGDQA